MLPDRVSNPGPLTYESGALPIALRGPAPISRQRVSFIPAVVLYRKGKVYKTYFALFRALVFLFTIVYKNVSISLR